jgi:hypothetical protein
VEIIAEIVQVAFERSDNLGHVPVSSADGPAGMRSAAERRNQADNG